MKPFQANLLNAVVLIAVGVWAYLGATSLTALIPAAFGAVLLAFTPALKKEGKVAAHIVVLVTLLVIVALFMPLRGAIGRDDTMAIIRVGLMMATSVFAMVMFIKSFIDVRRARQATES